MNSIDPCNPEINLNHLEEITREQADMVLDEWEKGDPVAIEAIITTNERPAITMLRLVAIAKRRPKKILSPTPDDIESFAQFRLDNKTSLEVACYMIYFVGLERAIEIIEKGVE